MTTITSDEVKAKAHSDGKQVVEIDAGAQVRVWRSPAGLHLALYQRDAREPGGWAAGPPLTMPAGKGAELAQAIQALN